MALGPELVGAWAAALRRPGETPDRVARVEGGREWVALQCWRSKDWLFLGWNADTPGLCRLSSLRMQELLSAGEPSCSLVQTLRAHVGGAHVSDVLRISKDRVLTIRMDRSIGAGVFRERHVILECASRYSNLILLDENGTVLEAAKHVYPEVNRYRSVVPGQAYTPPPPMAGFHAEEQGWLSEAPGSVGRLLGFGRPLLALVTKHWDLFSPECWAQAFRDVQTFPDKGILQLLGAGYLTLFPFALPESTVLSSGPILEESQRITTDPLRRRLLDAGLRGLRQTTASELHRLTREVEGFAHKEELFAQAEQRRLWGDLLLTHATAVEAALDKRLPSITLPAWDPDAPAEEIPLQPDRNSAANAQSCYHAYRKWKAYGETLERDRKRLDARHHDLEEQMAVLESMDDLQALRPLLEASRPGGASKKHRPAPPHLRYTLEGGIAYVGLNAQGNRHVTFEIASGEDLWFHAQGVPGAHVILKIEGGDPELLGSIAASLAASFSKAKESNTVAVDVTERRHVRHVPGQGVAFVTYHRFQTIRISPSFWKDQPHTVEERRRR